VEEDAEKRREERERARGLRDFPGASSDRRGQEAMAASLRLPSTSLLDVRRPGTQLCSSRFGQHLQQLQQQQRQQQVSSRFRSCAASLSGQYMNCHRRLFFFFSFLISTVLIANLFLRGSIELFLARKDDRFRSRAFLFWSSYCYPRLFLFPPPHY
jgi:hypothetical protein